jgi:hypothetical protein
VLYQLDGLLQLRQSVLVISLSALLIILFLLPAIRFGSVRHGKEQLKLFLK